MKEFKSIKNFVFDLDGTLYSDLEAVFGQVSKRMTEYISKKLNLDLKKAKELQTNYFHKYDTSLNGLLIHHDVKAEEFLEYVHDIDLEFMEKDIVLREELLKLDAKKFVFTNGSHGHVKQITKHL
jgi:putative hydrolase of the HAD superfamily